MRIASPIPTGSGAFILHRTLAENIPGYQLAPYNPWWTLFPPALLQLRDRTAELVHTAADYAAFVAPPSVPLIITFHNFVLDRFMREYSSAAQRLHYRTDLRLFTRFALQRASVVTAVSRFTADLVRRETGYEDEIHVIPNGVDLERFSPPPPKPDRNGEIRVLFSGNPTRRKGIQWLDAIAERLDPGIRIIGAFGLADGRNKFESANLETLGKVPYNQMPDLYRSVDLLLMPTVREGLSLAVLEAMASGLPVVATHCSSLPEQIEHGKGGFLCRLGDAEEFAARINQLAGSARMRREMGDYNRKVAEFRYNLATMIQSYRALFSRFAPSSNDPAPISRP